MAKCLRCHADGSWIEGKVPTKSRDDEITELRGDVEWLEAELAEAKDRITKDDILLNAMPGKFTEAFESGVSKAEYGNHWAVRVLAASFRETLADSENFMTVQVTCQDVPMVVTIRRATGLTVEEKYHRVAKELAEAKAILDKLPTTADGVPVSFGMTLYYTVCDEIIAYGPVAAAYKNTLIFESGFESAVDWSKFYSTTRGRRGGKE